MERNNVFLHILDIFGKEFFHSVDPLAQDGLSRKKERKNINMNHESNFKISEVITLF